MESAEMMWALLIFAAVVAIPLVVEATRKRMSEKAREAAPGQFAKLSQGITHYRWTGPEDGPVVVCIHGLTTPSFVWGGIAEGLSEMGYRVLTYDLYGRGYSDRPAGKQDRQFFLRQLDDLLEDQAVDDDLTVIGYSMGGAIATFFAASEPFAIRRLVLLAPAGIEHAKPTVLTKLLQVPVLGTWLMLVRYPSMLRAGLQDEQGLPSSVADINTLQEAELNWRGFVPAVTASLRGILSEPSRNDHNMLKKEGVPVLAVWGGKDKVIPLSAAGVLAQWNSKAQSVVLDDAGHGLPYSHTDAVLAAIDDFVHQRG
jgi:pimeloyl-ACP methyl ester carboxylesterase